jgi:hypothetical protein
MKRSVRFLGLALIVCSVAAFAADVTGTWTGTTKGPDGGDMNLTMNFKQDGAKLTGTVTGPQGDVEITDGKVDGDNISFNVAIGDMKIIHDGVIKSEDEIALKVKADNGAFPEMEMTLKRSK